MFYEHRKKENIHPQIHTRVNLKAVKVSKETFEVLKYLQYELIKGIKCNRISMENEINQL